MAEERDILERLRNYDQCNDSDVDEAADEIERLRKELSDYHVDYAKIGDELVLARREIERLQAALKTARNDALDEAYETIIASGDFDVSKYLVSAFVGLYK